MRSRRPRRALGPALAGCCLVVLTGCGGEAPAAAAVDCQLEKMDVSGEPATGGPVLTLSSEGVTRCRDMGTPAESSYTAIVTDGAGAETTHDLTIDGYGAFEQRIPLPNGVSGDLSVTVVGDSDFCGSEPDDAEGRCLVHNAEVRLAG